MNKLFVLANGYTKKYPKENEPFQIMTRVLGECGEVAQAVNIFEKSDIRSHKYGEPNKKAFAKEIMRAMSALAQLAIFYEVEEEIEIHMDKSLNAMSQRGEL